MKFFLDHDVPSDIGSLLRHWGHEATNLRDVLEITAPDEAVFAYVCEHTSTLVTCNRNHFLALAGSNPSHPGVIILIRRRTRHLECAHLHALIAKAGHAGLHGNINFA